jgi:hypothetical protein
MMGEEQKMGRIRGMKEDRRGNGKGEGKMIVRMGIEEGNE